jgi:hypothetical protein
MATWMAPLQTTRNAGLCSLSGFPLALNTVCLYQQLKNWGAHAATVG